MNCLTSFDYKICNKDSLFLRLFQTVTGIVCELSMDGEF